MMSAHLAFFLKSTTWKINCFFFVYFRNALGLPFRNDVARLLSEEVEFKPHAILSEKQYVMLSRIFVTTYTLPRIN